MYYSHEVFNCFYSRGRIDIYNFFNYSEPKVMIKFETFIKLIIYSNIRSFHKFIFDTLNQRYILFLT